MKYTFRGAQIFQIPKILINFFYKDLAFNISKAALVFDRFELNYNLLELQNINCREKPINHAEKESFEKQNFNLHQESE